MYQPRHFAETRTELLHGLIRRHPLATLVTLNTAGELQADAIPLMVEPAPEAPGGAPNDGANEAPPVVLRGHVARANPLWRDTRLEVDVLAVFQGAQAYVSPSWYAVKAEHGKVVPTWNYMIVQARGRLTVIEDAAWLRGLGRLTGRFETPLATAERPAWQVDDAPADYVDSMLRAIVGIEIRVDSLVGKWKLSQNRSVADRQGVIGGLETWAAQSGDADAAAMAGEISAGLPPG